METPNEQPLRVLTVDEIYAMEYERDLISQASGATSSEERQEAQRRAWVEVMNRAGIPPRYHRAHLLHNCAGWSEDAGRSMAYSVSIQFADKGTVTDRGRERFALFLTGDYGTGKTWLATAAFKNILARDKTGMWRKFYAFVREVQACYGRAATEGADAVISRYQRTALLLLDDVGDLGKGQETEDRTRILYEVLDYRNDHLLPTIITTNLMPDEMEVQFGARTFQRVLEMSAFVEMAGENLREVAA